MRVGTRFLFLEMGSCSVILGSLEKNLKLLMILGNWE